MRRLSDLNPGQCATITRVNELGERHRRFIEMGFVRRVGIVSAMLTMCTVLSISAQNFRTNNFDGQLDQMSAGQPPVGSNPFDSGEEEQNNHNKRDTTKKEPPKPLESYYFDNNTRREQMFSWSVAMDDNAVSMRTIDTMLVGFEVDMPFLRPDVGSAYLGNQPQASVPLNYFTRPDSRADFAFMLPFEAYIVTPNNAPFYNVKQPYTLLEYLQTGSEKSQERDFRVIHTQNITPSTGFNVYLYNPTTRGMYRNQGAADMNLSMGVSHTGKRYSVHGGYIYNYVRTMENGGLTVDSLVKETNIYEQTDALPVRLSNSENRSVGHTFYAVQSYGIPLRRLRSDDFTMSDVPALYVGNSIEYTRWGRVYSDTKSGSVFADADGNNVNYYDNWLINPDRSRDTIGETLLAVKAFLQMQPWDRDAVIGTLTVGAGIDVHHYSQFDPQDYLTGELHLSHGRGNDYYIYGIAVGKFRKYFDWGAKALFNAAGEIESDAVVTLSPYLWGHEVAIEGTGSYRRTLAPYWYEKYNSNHYTWDRTYDAENETRFGISLAVPDIGLELGAQQSISVNKFYMSALALPSQYNGTMSVSGIYAREDLSLGAFHFNHRVMLQWSDNQSVVPVPLLSAFASYFAEFDLVKNVLRLKIGVNGRYTTEYKGFGYNPALGMFYNQQEVEVGGYPMLDAFVVAKWKNMRIFFSVQHVNDGWFNMPASFFTVAHYPLNRRMFKFGISWNLYN